MSSVTALWPWGQPLDGLIQTAFVVEDLQAAMPLYAGLLEIGPWFLFERFEFKTARYRGRDGALDISLALGFAGAMMFELIEQHDDRPSPYRETIEQRGYGFHHWGVSAAPESYSRRVEQLQAQGCEMLLDAVVGADSRAAYLAAPSLPGMIEVIEVTPAVEQLFHTMQRASTAPSERGRVLPPPPL